MKSLVARLAEAQSRNVETLEPVDYRMIGAVFSWLDDRMVQNDALAAFREVFPDVSDERLLSGIGAVLRVIRQP